MTESILNLSAKKAKEFFIEEGSYTNISLPIYFQFSVLLKKLDKKLKNSNIKDFFIESKDPPSHYDDINYVIYNNKDGCYAWRP